MPTFNLYSPEKNNLDEVKNLKVGDEFFVYDEDDNVTAGPFVATGFSYDSFLSYGVGYLNEEGEGDGFALTVEVDKSVTQDANQLIEENGLNRPLIEKLIGKTIPEKYTVAELDADIESAVTNMLSEAHS